jgi:hypothetical protein
MIGRILALLGVILIVVAVLKFLSVVAIGGAAAGTLLVVGIVLLLVAYFLFNGSRAGAPL